MNAASSDRATPTGRAGDRFDRPADRVTPSDGTRGAQEARPRGAHGPRGRRGADANQPASATRESSARKPNPFGGARPVDSSAKMAEAERKIKEEKDACTPRRGWPREPREACRRRSRSRNRPRKIRRKSRSRSAGLDRPRAQGGARDQGEERVRAVGDGRRRRRRRRRRERGGRSRVTRGANDRRVQVAGGATAGKTRGGAEGGAVYRRANARPLESQSSERGFRSLRRRRDVFLLETARLPLPATGTACGAARAAPSSGTSSSARTRRSSRAFRSRPSPPRARRGTAAGPAGRYPSGRR